MIRILTKGLRLTWEIFTAIFFLSIALILGAGVSGRLFESTILPIIWIFHHV